MDNFNKTFGFEPSKKYATMHPYYKPDLDTNELCTDTEKAQYCKWIGEVQWFIYLGHIDIMYDTIVLSWYHPDPCKGHLYNIQHIYGYLNKYNSTSINLNT